MGLNIENRVYNIISSSVYNKYPVLSAGLFLSIQIYFDIKGTYHQDIKYKTYLV